MYKELKETEVKTAEQIENEHSSLAYLIIEPDTPVVGGIVQLHQGKLYAISDREGLDQLYNTAKKLKENGIQVLINTCPLDANKMFLSW